MKLDGKIGGILVSILLMLSFPLESSDRSSGEFPIYTGPGNQHEPAISSGLAVWTEESNEGNSYLQKIFYKFMVHIYLNLPFSVIFWWASIRKRSFYGWWPEQSEITQNKKNLFKDSLKDWSDGKESHCWHSCWRRTHV